MHLDRYRASGAELIMDQARFVAERTVDVELAEGGTHRISGDRVFLNLGTRARVPDVPGLVAARPMTHIELLDLDRLPERLIIMGGGYVGLELAQAVRRFGSRVTIIEQRQQLAGDEDADVGAAILELFHDEGIAVRLRTQVRGVEGKSGSDVRVWTEGPDGEGAVEGSDLLIAVGRTPNTEGIGLERVGVDRTGIGYIRVDERLATTAAGVWAMGECAGSPQFTHVVFAFGAEASELMAAVQTAMIGRVPYTTMRNAIFAHPTMAEGLTFLLRGTPVSPARWVWRQMTSFAEFAAAVDQFLTVGFPIESNAAEAWTKGPIECQVQS